MIPFPQHHLPNLAVMFAFMILPGRRVSLSGYYSFIAFCCCCCPPPRVHKQNNATPVIVFLRIEPKLIVTTITSAASVSLPFYKPQTALPRNRSPSPLGILC